MKKPKFEDYAIEIRPSREDEGGGSLATFPDLPGCMAEGETPEEALADAKAAFESWMDAQKEWGRPYPASASVGMSERFLTLSRNRSTPSWSSAQSRKA